MLAQRLAPWACSSTISTIAPASSTPVSTRSKRRGSALSRGRRHCEAAACGQSTGAPVPVSIIPADDRASSEGRTGPTAGSSTAGDAGRGARLALSLASWPNGPHRPPTQAAPERVLAVLTDPEAIRTWSPVPFELDGSADPPDRRPHGAA